MSKRYLFIFYKKNIEGTKYEIGKCILYKDGQRKICKDCSYLRHENLKGY